MQLPPTCLKVFKGLNGLKDGGQTCKAVSLLAHELSHKKIFQIILCRNKKRHYLCARVCPGGEIGRHASLRGWCSQRACRFKSCPGHEKANFGSLFLLSNPSKQSFYNLFPFMLFISKRIINLQKIVI